MVRRCLSYHFNNAGAIGLLLASVIAKMHSMKSLKDAIRPTLNAVAGPGWRDGLTLLENWGAIVGTDLAAMCTPAQVRFPNKERRDGTLVLAAPGAARLELQHHTPTILAKVNSFFGYGAVSRVQLLPGNMPAQPLIHSEAMEEVIDLTEALEKLGKAVAAKGL